MEIRRERDPKPVGTTQRARDVDIHRRRVAIGAGGVLCGLYAVDAALIVVTLLYRALR